MIDPTPVKTSSRTCFAIEYYADEGDAEQAAIIVGARGDRFNGGMFHGMRCGRAPEFDYVDPQLGKLLAVTRA